MKISESSLELAAQCWCDEGTSSIEMNSRLAIAFAKRLDAKDKRIAELEKEKAEALQTTEDLYQIIFSNIDIDFSLDIDHEDIKAAFQAHNLEQHDIAIRNAVKAVITPSIANHWNDDYQRGFMDCTTDILNQAKSLKEQGK